MPPDEDDDWTEDEAWVIDYPVLEVWESDNEPTAILYGPDGETVIAALYPRPTVFGFARYLQEQQWLSPE